MDEEEGKKQTGGDEAVLGTGWVEMGKERVKWQGGRPDDWRVEKEGAARRHRGLGLPVRMVDQPFEWMREMAWHTNRRVHVARRVFTLVEPLKPPAGPPCLSLT